MIISGSGFRAFSEYDLNGIFRSMQQKIKEKIQGDEDDADINLLVVNFRLEPVAMDEANMSVSDYEEMIPAEWFPHNFFVDPGERYAKKVVRYHLPFSGHPDLLHSTPSSIVMRSEEILIDGNEVCFDVINWNNDTNQMKRDVDEMLRYLKDQNVHVTTEVERYNSGLRSRIAASVEETKQKKKQNEDFMSSLGVPRKPHD